MRKEESSWRVARNIITWVTTLQQKAKEQKQSTTETYLRDKSKIGIQSTLQGEIMVSIRGFLRSGKRAVCIFKLVYLDMLWSWNASCACLSYKVDPDLFVRREERVATERRGTRMGAS